MIKKILFFYLILASVNLSRLAAQCLYNNAIADITLQCTGGSSSRTGVAYNPNEYLYYSVNAGSSTFPLETFAATGGNALFTTTCGADFRGYWWNPSTGKPEGNTYSSGGLYSNSLTAAYFASSTTSLLASASMPDPQSVGAGDITNNRIIYYSLGSIYKYNRATGAFVSSVLITGLPVLITNLNSYSIIYTGIPGSEVGLYDFVLKRVYFINYNTGAYVSTCNLPVGAPNPGSYGVSFANNRIFLFDAGSTAWIGYQIVNTNCTATTLNFDGVNDLATISSLGPWNMGSTFTFETWIRPLSLSNQLICYGGYGCIVCPDWVLSIGAEQTCFGLGTAGRIVFFGMGTFVQSDASPTIGAWTHVAVTYNGTTLKMYINGVQQTLSQTILGGTLSGVSYMNLGADPGCGIRYPYSGSLDEMRIWNKALCPSEILNSMYCEIPTTASGLTLNYHFNQGTANGLNTGVTTITDVSGSSSNGTLANFALSGTSSNWTGFSIINSGVSCSLITVPDINVRGNSITIVNTATLPTTANFTQYNTLLLGSSLSRTFVIQNTGTAPLTISNYSLSGTDASQFTITTAPAASVAASGSTSIVVTFSPNSIGVKSATVNIVSDDCDESPYVFAVEGTGVQPAEALSFDGVDDYVDLGNSSALKPNTITAELWAYMSSWTGTFTIIGNQNNSGWKIWSDNVNLIARVHANGNHNSASTLLSGISSGWHHLALTFDGRYIRLYVDGVQKGLNDLGAVYPVTFFAANNTLLGAEAGNTATVAANPMWFPGKVDELRIWNVARSQCEIQTYMNCEIPTNASNLVANYHFNQGLAGISNPTVTTLTDASSSAFTGTLNSFALTGTVSNWVVPSVVASNYTVSSAPSSSIAVTGNGNNVPVGISTTTLNNTDFGSNFSRSFIIDNTASTGTLYVNSVSLSGANSGDFTIAAQPSSSVTTGTTSFAINFIPTALGTRSAIVTIISSDCANPTYSFVISATAAQGSALNFDGVDDFIETGANLAELGQADFSIEAWIRTTGNSQGIVTCANANTSWEIGEKCFYIDGGGYPAFVGWGNNYILSNIAVNNGAWHHIAVVWNYYSGTSGVGKIYVDGVDQTGTVSYAGNNTNIGTFKIGRRNYFSGEAPNDFVGDLDEVRIWNRVLCLPEIINNMNCELPSPSSQPGLTGYYKLNGGIGFATNTAVTTATDNAVFTNNGTLTNFGLTNGNSSNWVNPGAVTNGSSCVAYTFPNISVKGGTVTILNGSSVPSPSNLTQFNNAYIGTSFSQTFGIYNTGTASLSISNFSLTGLNASEFSITSVPASSVAASGSTSIVITFSPSTVGLKSASLNIISSDCDDNPYSFAIEGTGIMAGAALNFDGTNDRVTANDFNLGTGDFTMETWIHPTAFTAPDMYILSNRQNNFGATGNWFNLAISANKLQIELGQAATSSNTVYVGTSTLGLNTWYHVAVVRSGLQYKLFVNGVLESIAYDPSARNITGNFGNVHIGGWPENVSGRWFNGDIDELRVWNIARTQCDIQTYMNTQINTTVSGLIANYHFNEGLVNSNNAGYSTLPDFSGSSNTGSLTSFALTGTLSNWVVPGAVVSGLSAPAAPSASILISGNSISITPSSVSTNTNNFTDFGNVYTRTFVIQNTGSGTLYINPPVTISGANASDFSIIAQPSNTISSSSTNVVVQFIPTALGSRSAMVIVNSSDCTTPDFSFAISGTAVSGSALNFDGLNDFASSPVFDTQTSNITLQARVNWNGTISNDKMIVYNGNSGTSGYGMYVANGTSSVYLIYGGIATYNTGYNLSPGIWSSLSMVLETSKLSFYVNGSLVYTVNPGAVPNTPNSTFNVGVGFNQGTENFNGSIDEVLLWDRALTQCEIQAYLNCEIATTASSLVANYHFNQGIAAGLNSTVTGITDVSGNNHHLTASNFTLSGTTSNWISPGALISGSSCANYSAPEINILGNAVSISDNDITPSSTDGTDFGNISNTGLITQTYTIQNTGNSPLSVTSLSLSGANATSFSVSALIPASPIPASNFATFTVSFIPSASGVHVATVNIINNDCDEATYDFAITGSVTAGAAFNFDGTNDFINVGNILTPSYTKEAWVKLSASTNGNNIMSSGSGTVGTALWAPGIYGYKLSAGHNLNWNVVQDPTALTLGIWYHVAVTYDAASNIMTLYKNGSSVASNTVAPFSGTDPLSIGAFSGSFVTTGSMDEVRIWNRALCQAEIQNNMNCEIPTTAMGLIGNYHFNQGVGNGLNTGVSNLTDASGYNNTGTLTNVALSGTVSNWNSTSTITTGSACSVYLTAEIDILGNGNSISDGDVSPSLTDHTDFGGICMNNTVIRTFTIQNTGNTTLTVNSLTINGTAATDFSISTLNPASPIPSNSLSIFTITFNPATSGVKTASVSIVNSDCNENPYDFVITGTCNPLPVVIANTSNSMICNGFTTSVFGSGADTYTWTNGVTNNTAFTPSTTANYTVSGTNTLTGCTSTNSAVQTITVNPTPTITAVQSGSVICYGASIDLTANGVASFTWEPGSFNTNSITVTPTVNTSYSVSGTSSMGCVANNTVILTVSVNPLPVVGASSSDSVICLNFTTSLNGSGANTYTWSGGVTNGTAFTPSITQSYTVNGTNTITGCTSTNSAVQTITVNSIPTIIASAVSSVICDGFTATLTASGANTYTWNPGSIIGSTVTTMPSITTIYTLNGTSLEGCTATNVAVQTISVNSLPTVSAAISNSVICFGSTVSLSGSGAQTFTWSNGVADGIAFTPTSNSTYTVLGTNSAGCTNTNLAVTSVTVNNLPSLQILILDSVLCIGDTTRLTASGAVTYTWSGGINNGTDFTPQNTSTYTVTATDINSCVNTKTALVVVNSLPSLTITSTSNPACIAQVQTISVSGAASYTWNTGVTNSSFQYTPTILVTFSVSAIDSNACVNSASFNQDVMICEITVFSGVTANNDGLNDVLTIQNIESYPQNKVSVFNRWGKEIFSISGYNNKDKSWPMPEEVSKLLPSTYFYIIDLGDGSRPLKGWVELIKN